MHMIKLYIPIYIYEDIVRIPNYYKNNIFFL